MVKIRFNWQGDDKVSSIFIGTSPEFEIAIYTLGLIFSRKIDDDGPEFRFNLEEEEYGLQIYCKSKWSNKHNCKKIQLESAFPVD